MIDTVTPSGTGVSSPWRYRTSSSATKTLTYRWRLPSWSSSRSRNPGWAPSRAAITLLTVSASTLTSLSPAVRVRRVVGTRTVTLIEALPRLSAAERGVVAGEDATGAQVTPLKPGRFAQAPKMPAPPWGGWGAPDSVGSPERSSVTEDRLAPTRLSGPAGRSGFGSRRQRLVRGARRKKTPGRFGPGTPSR